MTITTTKRKAGPYHGDGMSVLFPFDFRVFEAQDLWVTYADESGAERVLSLNTDYKVNLNIDQETVPGGNVILNKALQHGNTITLTSGMAYLQPTKLTNHGGFYPTVINDALDRLTIFVQQLEEQVDRSVKVTVSSETSPDELVASINESASAARQSAEAAQASENNTKQNAETAQNAAETLTQGLQDLAGVKTDVDNLQEAIVPATAAQIQNGEAGKLVDAAGIKNIIATDEDMQAGEEGKIVDAAGLKDHESSKFTIIYPNGGTEENPAKVVNNSRYVMNNPFPGKTVMCIAEVFYAGNWGAAGWGSFWISSIVNNAGVVAYQINSDDIIVQTGAHWVAAYSALTGSPFGAPGGSQVTNLPCRIKVFVID